MNHLSGLDAAFLHIESPEMPMHVGALNVLDLPEGYSGDFFEDARQYLLQRLHLADVFTRKLALMPFDLSNPVWVEDEDIDIDYHIRHITLPKPGTNRQLQQYVARLHSSLLDRSRPLWEFFLIDGLQSGQVALYSKLHHAGIDGQAGVAVGRAIFDLEPTGRHIKPPRANKPRRNQYQLGMAELAGAALRNTVEQYVKLFKLMPGMARAARNLLLPPESGDAEPASPLARVVARLSSLRGRQWLAPRTPFNVAITNQRSFAGRTVPLAEVKQIAKAMGVSVNDVVMATTSGALRRWLTENDELPARSLSAAVPVSLRDAGDATAHNQASMLLVNLATDEADTAKRLKKIHASSSAAKAAMSQVKAVIPTDFPMFGAPWLISGISSLLGRSRIVNILPPIANVAISNVAGSPVPMYFAGARVVSYYPVSIPAHGMALNVTVQSYNGRIDYGLIACRRALPDIGELGDMVLAEHRTLLALAAAHQAEGSAAQTMEATTTPAPPSARRKRKPQLVLAKTPAKRPAGKQAAGVRRGGKLAGARQ